MGGATKAQRDAAAKQARALGLLKGTSIWQEPPTPTGQLVDAMAIAPPGTSSVQLRSRRCVAAARSDPMRVVMYAQTCRLTPSTRIATSLWCVA